MTVTHSCTRALVVLFGLLLLAPSAGAQSCTTSSPGACTVNTSASMMIPAVMQISVSAGPGTQTATLAQFLAGYGEFAGPSVSVSANTGWALSVSAATPEWATTNTLPGVAARVDKPASDLLWSRDGATFAPLAVFGRQLAAGTNTDAETTSLIWRVLYSLALDTPGAYEMTVIFTITAP